MKKIFMMFALLMGIAVCANAQSALVDNGTAKDNWYIGAGVGTNVWNNGTSWTLFNTKTVVSDDRTNSWWRTQPLHANITIGKMFNPYLGAEVDYTAAFNLRCEKMFLDAHSLTGNAVVNLSNVIGGYYGTRRFFEVELLGGAGWLHDFSKHANAMSVRGALRGNFNLSKALAITVTPSYLWVPKRVVDAESTLMGVNLSVGVKWRIPTYRGNFPLRQLRNQAEIDDLKAQITSLQKANEDLAKANADLSETIKDLIAKGSKVTVKTKSIGTLHFEKGKADVNEEAAAEVIKSLKETDGTIVLTGSTSPEGKEKFNKALAMKRAKSVKAALVAGGIDESRITVKNDYENQRSVIITVE